MQNKAKCNIN